MSLHAAALHLHVTCVILSGMGFLLRGLLMLNDSRLLQKRWMKVIPHVNDTVLLVAALTLTVLIGQYPFLDSWLTAKVFGLIGYIIFGALALRHGRSRPVRVVCWLLALALFAYIVSVARTRHPCGYFLEFTALCPIS